MIDEADARAIVIVWLLAISGMLFGIVVNWWIQRNGRGDDDD